MSKFSKEQLQYVAGMVDAEGCIMMVQQIMDNGYIKTSQRVTIANTHLPVLEWIQTAYPGKLDSMNSIAGKKRTAHCLRMNLEDSYKFLHDIYPYLIVKKKEAEIYLESEKFYKARIARGDRFYTTEENDERTKLCEEMKGASSVNYPHHLADTIAPHHENISRAYIAGFFDGEGTIIVKKKSIYTYSLAIAFSNAHLPVLKKIANYYGMNVRIRMEPTAKTPLYEVNIHSDSIEHFLLDVLPYLQVLKERAILALDYLKVIPILKESNVDTTAINLVKIRFKALMRWHTFKQYSSKGSISINVTRNFDQPISEVA